MVRDGGGGACAGRPDNDPEHAGCDAVPTGLAYGPDGAPYVSTLSGEAPGLGIVYKINPYDGSVLDTIGGLDSPTGVAVGTGPDLPGAGQIVRVEPEAFLPAG